MIRYFFMPALQEKGILWQNDVMHTSLLHGVNTHGKTSKEPTGIAGSFFLQA